MTTYPTGENFNRPLLRGTASARATAVKCAALAVAAVCFLALSSSAHAAAGFTFCSFGSGAGQCEKPEGVAVDDSNGRVYVADRGNNRIDVFEAGGGFVMAFGWGVRDGASELQSCTTATTCRRGIAGSGLGQLDRPQAIAIDNDAASPAHRDVYVVDQNLRVQRFDPSGGSPLLFGATLHGGDDPIAVGPGGTVYLADSEFLETVQEGTSFIDVYAVAVKRFAASGTPLGESALPKGGFPQDLAVDSSGAFYVARYLTDSGGIVSQGIYKYEASEPDATLLDEIPGDGNVTALAVDPTDDDLLAAQLEAGTRVISEWDSAGTALRRFGYGQIEAPTNALAVAAAGDGVFGSAQDRGLELPGVLFIPFPPPGPLACCPQATEGSTWARIEATINPEGKASAYHVEYVDDAAFQGSGFATAKRAPVNPGEDPTLPADISLHEVSLQIGCTEPQNPPQASCLTPETKYHFRVVATNEDGKSEPSAEFTTKPPLEVKATFATEVGTDAAQLHAEVNPLGIPATGYFQYVDDATFEASGFTTATDVPDVGGGAAPIDFGSGEAASATSVQLASLVPGTTYHYRIVAADSFTTVNGPALAFTTFPLPAPPPSPDPCPNAAFRSGASANLPDCRAYEMVSPVAKGNADIAPLANNSNFPAGLDQSAEDGNSFSFSSQTAFGDAISAPYTSQYIATRHEGEGWSTHAIAPPRESILLSESAIIKFDTEFKAFSSDLSSAWFLHTTDPPLASCAAAGYLNLYRRDNATGVYEALTIAKPSNGTAANYVPELQGVSADGSVAVFRANGKLTKDASGALIGPGAPIYQLYEHLAGEGCGQLRLLSVLPNGKASGLASSAGTRNPSAAPEARVNAVATAVSEDGSRVFWTAEGAGEEGPLYLRIDGKETVEVSPGLARFWTAAADGSKAIYTLGNSGQSKAKLYEFDLATKASAPIAEGVSGVLAASEDASHLYFVSAEALGGEGEAGKPNLYLHEAGTGTKLVATLAAADLSVEFVHYPLVPLSPEPNKRGVRTTPDGRHLLFVSSASLTGYDNKDAADGRSDVELYLYDAEDDQLRCISCNPTGARPAGRLSEGSNKEVRRVAAQLAPWENQLYAPRDLSTDGNRLFFDSFEALVPRDTSGKEDVYEWERAAGEARCEELGAELYVESAGGCLSLISSGQSPTDSEFDDASPDGKDVFIKTASSLLPQDPGLIDVYDAREGGGLPAPPTTPPSCEGEACQGPPEAPNDPTPASSAFEGAGNVVKPAPSACRKPKVRRKGRCVARHHKRHAKHKRRAGR